MIKIPDKYKAVVTYPSICSLMIKVRALYARAPRLGVSGARMRNSKLSIGIVFVGDKDRSIGHQNHVHQRYYKSEPFHDHF